VARILVAVPLLLLIAASYAFQNPSTSAERSQDIPVYEKVAPGTTPPKAVYAPPPEYSEKGRKKKIQGIVMLMVTVAKDGTVHDPEVTRSLELSLDKQAILAVQKWKFQPATKDGEPMDVRVAVEVSFHLYLSRPPSFERVMFEPVRPAWRCAFC